MRPGKIDPMVFIFVGAAVGSLLMFTCFRAVSTTLGPSIQMTGAASEHFGTSVNVTDRNGVLTIMITDTGTVADTTALDGRARTVARWVMTNRKDTTRVRRMSITTYRPQEGTVIPRRVHDVTWGPADLDTIVPPGAPR